MSSTADRQPGHEDSSVLTLVVEQDNGAPGVARGAVSAFCEKCGVPDWASAKIKLLVSEVVTNAVTHAHVEPTANVRLSARLQKGIIRVEVTDQGHGFMPAAAGDAPLRGSGYGLFLLDKEALSWGVDDVGGNRVWFEVSLD